MASTYKKDLVSVIIPCYNHGMYLADSIRSVLQQTYQRIEIIVVDDGSTDNTALEVKNFPEVKYIYQTNQGLSASRNHGFEHSEGEFLVFLDADDLLYPYTIAFNLNHLQQYTDAAFVSGAYQTISHEKLNLDVGRKFITQNHYQEFLIKNYIGMHATVMYRRFVFDEFAFDESLKTCEDYDLYLRVARKYPVVHHTRKLAAYRMHQSNMSKNAGLMLQQSLYVLEKQKDFLRNEQERAAYELGRQLYIDYYCSTIFARYRIAPELQNQEDIKLLKKYKRKKYYQLVMLNRVFKRFKLINLVPDSFFRWMYKRGVYHSYIPRPGKVKMGDLNRKTPIGKNFGYDRGGPIDRFYIEDFLKIHRDSIQGRVLEIGEDFYTTKFGGEKVTTRDVLHVNDTNEKATIVADLSNAPQIQDHTFDCIILVQTLHMIYDFDAAIKTIRRILKPGGVLLLTVPGITPVDFGEWEKTWLWSFTRASIEKLMDKNFPSYTFEVVNYGNVHTATAFLNGLGLPEINKQSLHYHDYHYPVIIAAKVINLS